MDSKIIKHIASLARIELTAKEEDKMRDDLSSILKYVEQLSKVNTDNVEPLYQTTGLINSTRADENLNNFKLEDVGSKLVAQAPEKENGFVRVKSILSK